MIKICSLKWSKSLTCKKNMVTDTESLLRSSSTDSSNKTNNWTDKNEVETDDFIEDYLETSGQESDDEYDGTQTVNPVEDSYSFLYLAPFSFAFLVGIFVCSLQFVMYFLSLQGFFSNGTDLNPLGIPVGVVTRLRVVQFFSIVIVFSVHPSFSSTILTITNGYDEQKLFNVEGIPYWRWFLSNTLRVIECVSSLAAVMAYVVGSDDLVDLLKDITALMFVSEIDDGIFLLCQHGFFGPQLKASAKRILDISYTTGHSLFHPFIGKWLERCVPRPSKRNFMRTYIRPFFLIFSFFFCVTIWLLLCVLPQEKFELLEPQLFVQWDDNLRPDLAFLSGFYKRTPDARDKRVVYSELRASHHDSLEPAIFRFCEDLKAWVFTIKGFDECNNYIA